MSNLQTARNALLAELKHAREGLAFYQSQVEALEKALASLTTLNGEAAPAVKRGRAKKSAVQEATLQKPARAKKEKASLPATGKDFWTSLVTNEPQSSRQLLDAAVKSLGITPSKDDLKKLAQRQANALHMLVKAKAISDSGTGRERRYTR